MTRYVAMLRGVNVGGRRVKMDALKEVFVAAGHEDVVTYVQSGNVVFNATRSSEAKLVSSLQQAIADDLSLPVPVLVRTAAQLAAIMERNPFLGQADPAHLHVTFLDRVPAKPKVAALPGDGRLGADELRLVGREVYLHCPNGYGTTKLTNTFFEKKLAVTATTRNWRSVGKLLELAGT